MTSFLLRRLGFMLLTLFVMASAMFFLFRLLPGDPTATVISPALHPDAQAVLKARFGLDKPLWQQYLAYIANLARLDFGYSFETARPVSEVIGDRLANTLLLLLPSLIAAYVVGALIGAFIAWRRAGALDTIIVVLATALQSAPVFWVGMMAILFFSLHLDLFPVGHIVTPGRQMEPGLMGYLDPDVLHHLALPFFVNFAYQLCFPLLLMRTSMLATIGEDFIDLARMKGLSERKVLMRHAMRNALLPLATTLPMLLGWAVAGSVVIETVFSWPGLGLLMVGAVERNDYPVVQACFMLSALLTVMGTFIADLLYGALDPRIAYE
ncbi:MAG: ABC transporter permease [Proteobacteria bacterium]|nr:ABC transporter permease [Pseudomonadota bacterium]